MMESILPIIIAIVAFYILRSASKFLLKLFGGILLAVAVLLLAYQYNIGPFKRDLMSLKDLEKRFCQDASNSNKCECIIKPVMEDVQNRFSQEEIGALGENKIKEVYVFKKSLDIQEAGVKECLKDRGAEAELKEFYSELFHLDSGLLGKAEDWFSIARGKVEEQFEDLKDDKEDIDDRY